MTWRHPSDRDSWAKRNFDAGTRRLIEQQRRKDRGPSEGDETLSPPSPSAPPDNVIPFDPWSRKTK